MSVAWGDPVTESLLRQMPRYRGRVITQVDLAREASRLMNDRGKNIGALAYVLGLKAEFGNGCSTHVLIYNATGTTLELVQSQDWSGSNFKQVQPRRFENGQWIAFLHVRPGGPANDSCGARVFRGTDVRGQTRDFFVAWNTPWNAYPTKVLTEIRGKDHFPGFWAYLHNLLRSHQSRRVSRDTTDQNFKSSMTIGGLTSPECITVLQHKFEPLPDEY